MSWIFAAAGRIRGRRINERVADGEKRFRGFAEIQGVDGFFGEFRQAVSA